MTRTAILGVGHYAPSRVVTNDDLAKMFATSDEWIQQRTGIRERRFIEHDGIGASDLAVPAVQMACERAGCDVKEIDAIIFATLSPDYNFPGSAVLMTQLLGIPGTPALDIRNQCSGFAYGTQIADAYVRSGMYRRVLFIGSEVHSTGLDLTTRGRDVSVIFGDGAAAVIYGPSDDDSGVLATDVGADGSYAKELWLEAPGSRYMPRLTPAMMEEGRHYPRMNGREVFKHAVRKMPETVMTSLGKAGLKLEDVKLFIPHQANLRISEGVQKVLGLPDEKVYNNISKYGNTTAASIPLAMDECIRSGRLVKGDILVCAAFGAGFTWGSAVIRI